MKERTTIHYWGPTFVPRSGYRGKRKRDLRPQSAERPDTNDPEMARKSVPADLPSVEVLLEGDTKDVLKVFLPPIGTEDPPAGRVEIWVPDASEPECVFVLEPQSWGYKLGNPVRGNTWSSCFEVLACRDGGDTRQKLSPELLFDVARRADAEKLDLFLRPHAVFREDPLDELDRLLADLASEQEEIDEGRV
jgi:hypothetical protein